MSTFDLLSGLRILIVEDEALIAEELEERLRRGGMKVVGIVDSADAAVEAAVKTRPDLVLMDIQIRGPRDGIGAAGEIRRHIDVPVVYLTAHSDRATLDRAKDTAPFGYILKPFRERELFVAIEMASHRFTLERRLRESERRFVSTLASIGDGVIAVDLGNRITFMNPVAEALTGFRADDALGRPADEVFRVVRDVNDRTWFNPISEALRAGTPLRFDDQPLFLITKLNEAIPIDDSASPIVDDEGVMTGGVVAFRDLRDRRLAQDAIQRAEEEVFQSRRMELAGRFAGGIAHQFNNFLQVINGCTQLALMSQSIDPETRELLQHVLKAGDRAAKLTRQFRVFSQQQLPRTEIVDLNALVTTSASILRRLLAEQVVLRTDIVGQAVPICVDAIQIEQVIVNLSLNARDAMPDGGTLTISTGVADAPPPDAPDGPARSYGTLSVVDTGHGMNGGSEDHRFERFFATRRIGIGLASAYGIVNQSGGFIMVRSAPGAGATFTVYLPTATARAA